MLRDLLQDSNLELELRAGPESVLETPISGAHSIEIANPSRWLGRHWAMLTTGARLRGRSDQQQALIAELAEAEVSALGFAVDVVFKEIPEAILEEAERRSFPVFAVPLEIAFREVIAAVNRSVLSSEFRAVQRLTSIQRHLLDAFEEDDPRAAIVARLARVLDASISVVIPGEATEQTPIAPPPEQLVRSLSAQAAGCAEIELEDWHVFGTPIPGGGWLVAASRRNFVNALTKPAMQSAVPLLVATRHLQEAVRRHDDAASAALLEDLIAESTPAEQATLRLRAEMAGLDLGQRGRVVVIGRSSAEAAETRALTARLGAHLGFHAPLATSLPGGEAVIFVQSAGSPLVAAVREMTDADSSLQVGIGRETLALAEIRESFRDARQAVDQIRRGGAMAERVVEFDSLDLRTILVASAAEDRIRPKLEETLAELREHPHLYEALVAYFELEMDVAAAADRLFLHTNSLRYRLNRIEDLLGKSLKNPATIANLHLALSADEELRRDRAESPHRQAS